MPGKPKHYTPEFKEQAVKKVVDSSPPRTITEVARENEINETTLSCWVKDHRRKAAGGRSHHGGLPGSGPGLPDLSAGSAI